MSVSPTGNVILVNQQSHIASNASSNLQNRFDLQNLAAMIKANELDETKSVRPTEANHEIDPENEHEKEKIDEEEKQRQKNRQKEDNSKKSEKSNSDKDDNKKGEIITSHILDLKG